MISLSPQGNITLLLTDFCIHSCMLACTHIHTHMNAYTLTLTKNNLSFCIHITHKILILSLTYFLVQIFMHVSNISPLLLHVCMSMYVIYVRTHMHVHINTDHMQVYIIPLYELKLCIIHKRLIFINGESKLLPFGSFCKGFKRKVKIINGVS